MKNIFLISSMLLLSSIKTFSQSPQYQIYALKYAAVAHPTPISEWALGAPPNDSVNVDFMIWLINGNNSKHILVDAGFLKDITEAKDFDVKGFVRPDSMLARVGLRPEDITDIIITHPHWDHLDGVDLFPNAHVWIQKEDFNYFVGTAWQNDSTHGGFNKRDVIKLIELNIAGRLTLVDGDNKQIIPGIKVYTGSRHTFNSQFVLVETGPDKIIIASDNIWVYYNLEHLKSAPPYGTFDTTAYVTSMKRMKTLASNIKFIIPGHDAAVFSRFPSVAEDVIRIR